MSDRLTRLLASLAERLRGGFFLIQDLGYRLGRLPREIGPVAERAWSRLGSARNRGLLVAAGAVVALLAIVVVAAAASPCWLPGGDSCSSSEGAAELVPGDALAYLRADLDPDGAQYQSAAALADRVPNLAQQVVARLLAQLPAAGGSPPDFERDIQAWFGGELAVAIVPTGGGGAEQVDMLEAADADGASAYAEKLAAGSEETSDYRGIEVRTDARGIASALVGGFLVIGTDRGVRAVIDVDTGAEGATSLDGDDAASDLLATLPDQRLAEAYISPSGIAELIGSGRGALASLEPFIDAGASRGAAAALVADHDGFSLAIRSALDPERSRKHPSFFSAFPPFEPRLTGTVASGALAYVGFGDPGSAIERLLAQASEQAPRLAAGLSDLLKQFGDLGKVDLRSDLLGVLGDEGALALQPGSQPGVPAATPAAAGPPFVEFLAGGVDSERARRALAGLRGPIAAALAPPADGGEAATFRSRDVDGTQAESLRITPAFDLTYALIDSMLVIASDPAAVEETASGGRALDRDEAFVRATDGLADEPSLLVYLNVTGLLGLAEQQGLAENPAYATFAGELHRLQALGLSVSTGEDELATDARLVIGARPGATGAAGAG
jgi:hypothetical protein